MTWQPMPSATPSSVAEMLEDGKSRRAALMGGKKSFVSMAERKTLQDEISRLNDTVLALRTENKRLVEAVDEKNAIIHAQEQTINGLTQSEDGTEHRRTVKEIILSTLNEFPKIKYAEVVGASRAIPIVEARHTCIYAVRKARPDLSLPQIGKLFGGRDHTSILWALRKMEARFNG